MKIVFTTILFFSLHHFLHGQTIEVDTSVTSKYRITNVIKEPPPEATISEETKDEKKGLGDLMLSLGEGFINRLKYRFNLSGIENKFEQTSERFSKEEKEKKGG